MTASERIREARSLRETREKRCEDIGRGDIVMFLGRPHLVDHVEDYSGPFGFIIGVARSADGWGISLERGGWLNVA